ncbi:MAG TPA: hypothetical protein VJI71_00530 [Candidatus Norongarragalinales archaeon]|nr:hypothetical protein [Candidatus Norongarragalinales archaeon]
MEVTKKELENILSIIDSKKLGITPADVERELIDVRMRKDKSKRV